MTTHVNVVDVLATAHTDPSALGSALAAMMTEDDGRASIAPWAVERTAMPGAETSRAQADADASADDANVSVGSGAGDYGEAEHSCEISVVGGGGVRIVHDNFAAFGDGRYVWLP